MRILLTGGTGFLGRRLCAELLGAGHSLTVLSRRPEAVARLCGAAVRPLDGLEQWREDDAFDAVVNLAGAPIFDRRWSDARKAELWSSRVAFTRSLVTRMAQARRPPPVLVSGSAIGFYGDRGDRVLTEQAEGSNDFLGRLCAEWEAVAAAAGAGGTRVCLVRTGLVLHPSGGLLRRMLLPFRCALGARLGDGRQWMSWIHLDDWTGLTVRLLTDAAAQGVYNLTAPEPVTNAAFTAALADAVHRPAWAVAPAGLLRGLLGERASLLLASQRVVPQRGEALGYRFRHARLDEALRSCAAISAAGPSGRSL